MKVTIESKRSNISAIGEYDLDNNTLIVKKGSLISNHVDQSPTFRAASSIEKLRAQFTQKNIVQEDVPFKSPSTAANFVCGASTNGLRRWRTEDGITIKELKANK